MQAEMMKEVLEQVINEARMRSSEKNVERVRKRLAYLPIENWLTSTPGIVLVDEYAVPYQCSQ